MKFQMTSFDAQVEHGWRANLLMHLATEFIKAHPLVAAVPDGEDSAGRQQLRLQTPTEIVDRGVRLAELLASEAEARGWIEPVTPEEAIAGLDGLINTRVRIETLARANAYRVERQREES